MLGKPGDFEWELCIFERADDYKRADSPRTRVIILDHHSPPFSCIELARPPTWVSSSKSLKVKKVQHGQPSALVFSQRLQESFTAMIPASARSQVHFARRMSNLDRIVGTIAGIQTMPAWRHEFFPSIEDSDDVPSARLSLIVSILSVGTFIGALAAGLLADWTGRKWGIILSAMIPFNLGVALQTGASTQEAFIAGRFFAGLGVGLVSVQIPMYQAETLPKWIRGFIVGTYQLAITIGLLFAALANYGTGDRADSGAYRIPLGVQFVFSLILSGGMAFLPETPRCKATCPQ